MSDECDERADCDECDEYDGCDESASAGVASASMSWDGGRKEGRKGQRNRETESVRT